MPGREVSLQAAVPLTAFRLARERRMQEAEAELARERLLEVLDTLPELQEDLEVTHLRAAAEAAWASEVWETKVVPALDDFESATERLDASAISAAAKGLAEALGFELRFRQDDEIIEALADRSVPLSIGKAPRRRSQPSSDLLSNRLGPPAKPPAGLSVDAVFASTRARRVLAHRDAAGVQVLRPGAYGSLYDHHGLLLGDGSVVHFNGEAGRRRKQDALIRRASYATFLDKADHAAARSVVPRAVRSRPVVPLRPTISCLRALDAIGCPSWEYKFLRNNCEHFATWSLLGASHSSQTRVAGQIQRWADTHPDLAPLLAELVGDDVTAERAPAPAVSSSEGEDPLWYDVGRAFWNPDANDVIAWVPVWHEGPALGAADHPWRASGLRGALTPESWLPLPPAPLLDGGWHAALVAVVSGARDATPGRTELYWILPDGSWLRENARFIDLVEPRLRFARLLIEVLGTSLIEMLSDISDAVRGTRPPAQAAELGPG